MSYFFTSESVSEGHPDKIADAISDGILDAALKDDPNSHVACETMVTTGLVVVGGEITTETYIDVQEVVRQTIRNIGYTNSELRFDADACGVINTIHSQSPDIAMGVDPGGAGDQGLMFGYATNQTPEYMPMPIVFAHKLVKRLAEIRKKHTDLMPYIRPDAKSQVTIEFDDNNKPIRVEAIVVSTQHDPNIKQSKIKRDVIEHVIKHVIPEKYLDKKTKYFVNPTGKFVIGGPHGDAGLTGRKIIVDTYGGWARHGGGAFSGKDATKVDRSAAYAARHIAKNIVASKIASECEVQLAYAIGVPEPVAIYVNTNGSGKIPDLEIASIIKKEIDLTPKGIIDRLQLRKPVFRKTAAYGHFGRKGFSWEKLDLVSIFKKYI